MARPSSGYSAVYPESANNTRLITTVRVTLNTTLTKSQNRHPLLMSCSGLPYRRSDPSSTHSREYSSERPRVILFLIGRDSSVPCAGTQGTSANYI